jgi:hypothetical protein
MPTEGFADTSTGVVLADAARRCRMVFFTGLPACGKSFLLREQVKIASAAGRRVHLIRWDIGLAAFEQDAVLATYPGVADGTNPILRRAAGLWGRQAVARWETDHPDPADMLIGEVPIIGNRFSEFIEVRRDEAEAALSSDETLFIYPVPTRDVRHRLEDMRKATFAAPQHPDEAKDAPPSTMDLAWRLSCEKAVALGLVRAAEIDAGVAYDPAIYRLFFDHLLKHRRARAIDVDRLYPDGGPAHDLPSDTSELIATPGDVATAISATEAVMDAAQAAQEIQNWYRV